MGCPVPGGSLAACSRVTPPIIASNSSWASRSCSLSNAFVSIAFDLLVAEICSAGDCRNLDCAPFSGGYPCLFQGVSDGTLDAHRLTGSPFGHELWLAQLRVYRLAV